jgi:hypothetical protein
MALEAIVGDKLLHVFLELWWWESAMGGCLVAAVRQRLGRIRNGARGWDNQSIPRVALEIQ